MSASFEQIDCQTTPMGDISLRRRLDPTLGIDVYEVKLGDEFLMSSLFTVAETALATLSLAALDASDLDVVVGGLGLGYTAAAVLADLRVGSLRVVEALDPVIEWHRARLVPTAAQLVADDRCTLLEGDFFALVDNDGFASASCDAVLVDIDHAPDRVLHARHASFYTAAGLAPLRASLRAGGVFGLWSDDPPDAAFLAVLAEVFTATEAHVVDFRNPYNGERSSNTVYVAHR